MIIPTLPVIEDRKTQESVRKALLEIARQLNAELDAIRERLDALEATP